MIATFITKTCHEPELCAKLHKSQVEMGFQDCPTTKALRTEHYCSLQKWDVLSSVFSFLAQGLNKNSNHKQTKDNNSDSPNPL